MSPPYLFTSVTPVSLFTLLTGPEERLDCTSGRPEGMADRDTEPPRPEDVHPSGSTSLVDRSSTDTGRHGTATEPRRPVFVQTVQGVVVSVPSQALKILSVSEPLVRLGPNPTSLLEETIHGQGTQDSGLEV